jgi:archaellum component FlaC
VKKQALAERKIELYEERAVLVASVCAGDRYAPERITSLVARLDEIEDDLHAVRRELQSTS